jgi:hypothetical protein
MKKANKNARRITDRAKRYRANAEGKNIAWGKRVCHYCGRKKERLDIDHVDGDEANGDKKNLGLACRPCNVLKGLAFKKARRGKRTMQYNPATSKAQYRLARAVIAGESTKLPMKVAREIVAATPEPGQLPERAARNPGARTPQQYITAALTLRGEGNAANMAEACELIQATPHNERGKFAAMMNPGAHTLGEYMQAVLIHTRKAHDAGGKIIHETPKSRRRKFASEIWSKRQARGSAGGSYTDEPPF